MYTDPQVVTLATTDTDFVRVPSSDPGRKGNFKNDVGDYSLDITQSQTNARFRREVRLTQAKVANDPITGLKRELSASAIIVIDEPKWGFDNDELSDLAQALQDWFSAEHRTDLLQGQA